MIAPVDSMSREDLIEYIAALEDQNRDLRLTCDNRHKLSAVEVRQIRRLYRSGEYTNKEIAEEYGVNPETIRRICIGIYHRNVA